MAQLRYGEPPSAPKRQNLMYQLSMMTLEPRDRWGEWVHIGTYATNETARTTYVQLRYQRDRKLPAGRWEFRYGKAASDNDGFEVWARYLGEDE